MTIKHFHFSCYIWACAFLLIGTYAYTAPGVKPKPKQTEQYTCLAIDHEIVIDGVLDYTEWGNTSWTNYFVDIEGSKKPNPLQNTRVKMLWDEKYFYIAAEIKETDIWATYTQRDAVIYHENDFEVFIDPDGDTHEYYELEINALGTVWDLLLTKPYRDNGSAINAWDITGLKKGIYIDGTINDPSDKDNAWYVELALPWEVLKETAPDKRKPKAGETWYINFSRVNWRMNNIDGQYVKQDNPETNKTFPEYNWVWSPQGVVAMHQPETWGTVTFAEKPSESNDIVGKNKFQTLLRNIYYAQKAFKETNGNYASNLDDLPLKQSELKMVKIATTPSMFEAWINIKTTTWHINHDGKNWSTNTKEPIKND